MLIAGADAGGVRLALELADAGLPVTLCTRGTLSPEAGGALGSSLYDEVPLLTALRNHPGDRAARGRDDRGDRAASGDGLAARVRVRAAAGRPGALHRLRQVRSGLPRRSPRRRRDFRAVAP